MFKGKIFAIHNTFYEVEVFRNEFFTVVHDEYPTNVQLDVVLAAFFLEKIRWGAFWHKQKSTELELSFH